MNGPFSPKASSVPSWADEEAIREELFSVERLEQHAERPGGRSIGEFATGKRAAACQAGFATTARPCLKPIGSLPAAIREKHLITPAAEWLVDNFHIAEDQIREIRNDLPPSYTVSCRNSRKVRSRAIRASSKIAWAFVAHTDSRFEAEMLQRFVLAYQRIQPLTIGELWALAITIRVVLVGELAAPGRSHRRQPEVARCRRRTGRPAAFLRRTIRPTRPRRRCGLISTCR